MRKRGIKELGEDKHWRKLEEQHEQEEQEEYEEITWTPRSPAGLPEDDERQEYELQEIKSLATQKGKPAMLRFDPSVVDFTAPDACSELKQQHDRCFYPWLKRFATGAVHKDDCKEEWEIYDQCIKKKLEHYELSHLQSEWQKPSFEQLDDIDRSKGAIRI
ncbi:hypothetical protein QOT17_003592 [Balamuthia mandrillaris]